MDYLAARPAGFTQPLSNHGTQGLSIPATSRHCRTLGPVAKLKVWRYNGPASNAELEAAPHDRCRRSPTRHLRPRLENPAPLLPGGPGKVGGPAQDNRRFSNAVFWALSTGTPWRDLPPDYGHWNTTHNRFRRWQKNGTWAQLLSTLAGDPDLEWLMIDGSAAMSKCIGTAPERLAAIRR